MQFFSLNRLPTVRKVEIPSTCGCDLVTDGHMNLWLVEMMYCEYWIGPNQRSLTLKRDLNFQVMQVQFLLVVKENYLLHRLASLKGLQPNCYHHTDCSFMTLVLLLLVISTSINMVKMAVLIPKVPQCHDWVFLFLLEFIMPFFVIKCKILKSILFSRKKRSTWGW